MNLMIVGILVIIIDQVTKYLIANSMAVGESIAVIPGVFHLTYILNPGAAFGLLENSRIFFLAIALICVIAAFIFRKYILKEGKLFQYGMALFIGGALGNVIDRANNGLVRDFFDFRIWPIFNVADIAICVGVAMIVISVFITDVLEKK
jgi:signal peptidase II